MRLIRLKTVVLPAPLGPISVNTSPRRTSKPTSLTASTPPKRTVSPCTDSNGPDPEFMDADPWHGAAKLAAASPWETSRRGRAGGSSEEKRPELDPGLPVGFGSPPVAAAL